MRLLTASHVGRQLAPSGIPQSEVHKLYCKPGTPVSIADMRAARRYAPFAMAAYGALYYVYVNPKPHRLFELCCGRFCPLLCGVWPWSGATNDDESPRRRPRQLTAADLANPAGVMNKDAICHVAGIAHDKLRHVHSMSRFNESVPYFIAVDEASKAIVISIRGTLRYSPAWSARLCLKHRPLPCLHVKLHDAVTPMLHRAWSGIFPSQQQ